MRCKLLMLTLMAAASAWGSDYLYYDFSSAWPSEITVIDADGIAPAPDVYAHTALDKAWVANRLPGAGYCAMSPTRTANPDAVQENWMILPAVAVSDPEAAVVWKARSLHKHLLESYSVRVRELGSDAWTQIAEITDESYTWTLRHVPLAAYAGKEVEVAFVATTNQGFMLCIDEIEVGAPRSKRYDFRTTTPRFVGAGPTVITGVLSNFGPSIDCDITLSIGGETVHTDYFLPASGESIDIEIPVDIPLDSDVEYILFVGDTEVFTDRIGKSQYPRLSFIDRCSGTWCNSCPHMELTVDELDCTYRDGIFVAEVHINDIMGCADYNRKYISEFVYGIPDLIANHNRSTLQHLDLLHSEITRFAEAGISAVCTRSKMGKSISIDCSVEFPQPIDNSTDRYRIGYLMLGDYHSDERTATPFIQQNSSLVFNYAQYYYQSDYILPEMMFYDNVPIEASTAIAGVPASVVSAAQSSHSYTLAVPAGFVDKPVKVLALLIDTTDGHIVNCCLASDGAESGIEDITVDSDFPGTDSSINNSSSAEYFDIYGRRLSHPAPGIVIRRTPLSTNKHLLN